jgi:hypothetical protein
MALVLPTERENLRFEPGQVLMTPGAKLLGEEVLSRCLGRHLLGDWGDVGRESRGMNEAAISAGDQLMSVYRMAEGEDLWIITEGEGDDRVTTLLLPSEN